MDDNDSYLKQHGYTWANLEAISLPSAVKFAVDMRAIHDQYRGDPEVCHSEADGLLISTLRALGYGDGCDVYEQLPKWYA